MRPSPWVFAILPVAGVGLSAASHLAFLNRAAALPWVVPSQALGVALIVASEVAWLWAARMGPNRAGTTRRNRIAIAVGQLVCAGIVAAIAVTNSFGLYRDWTWMKSDWGPPPGYPYPLPPDGPTRDELTAVFFQQYRVGLVACLALLFATAEAIVAVVGITLSTLLFAGLLVGGAALSVVSSIVYVTGAVPLPDLAAPAALGVAFIMVIEFAWLWAARRALDDVGRIRMARLAVVQLFCASVAAAATACIAGYGWHGHSRSMLQELDPFPLGYAVLGFASLVVLFAVAELILAIRLRRTNP